jgi:hypothetical protein
MNKYTVQKAYGTTPSGKERVVWNVMEGNFVVDTFNLKRDAVYYAKSWNQAAEVAARDE